ncbi:MAG: hypothetical protein OEW44_04705 [Gemmatimonadota bacterium]|jgi:gluconolactonase|nr:hypothetical protein [Gemmatimonadota bacterium]
MNRRRLARVTEDLDQPNGIIGTPDGIGPYVSDLGAGRQRGEITMRGD